MNDFINKLSLEYDIQIPNSEVRDKGMNSYSLDSEGNVIALYLDGVNIRNLDVLLPIADSLKELSLDNCSIKDIHSPMAFINLKKLVLVGRPFKQDALDNLIQLRNLEDLNLNLTDITDSSPLGELPNLSKLDLSYNTKLKEIKGLEKLDSLKSIRLDFSAIDSLEKIVLHENIDSLHVGSSRITKISNLERYMNLTNLDLSGNRIIKIESIDHLKKLKRLSLSCNNIVKLEGLNDLVNLETLDLSVLEIEKIEGLDKLINLKRLNLLDNEISKVENLDNLHKLEYLLLDRNNITEFDPTFLSQLSSPCYISLIGNPLKELPFSIPDHITVEFTTDHWVPRVL